MIVRKRRKLHCTLDDVVKKLDTEEKLKPLGIYQIRASGPFEDGFRCILQHEVTMRSFGEVLTIDATPQEDGCTLVTIHAVSRLRNQLFDFGLKRKLVREMMRYLDPDQG